MFSWIKRTGYQCLNRVRNLSLLNRGTSFDESLMWSRGIGQHSAGEFSIAALQANETIEDYSQVEIGRNAIFVGVYDGHGGTDAAQFVCDNLFPHLIRLARVNGLISEATIRNAFAATEDGFLALVRRTREMTPLITTIGSCCLVGLIWEGNLFVANLGDSRAVLGRCLGRSTDIIAEPFTSDHNVSSIEIRQDLRSHHPDDPQIVLMKNGAWRVKGIIQVSRSIGDAYLKSPEFTVDPSLTRFHLSEPLRRPILSAVPAIDSKILNTRDKFVIFASDGLWEQLTNQEAVNIVKKNPREGIAKKLIKSALDVAAKKHGMSRSSFKKLDKRDRRNYHDDITVIVVFIDHQRLSAPSTLVQGISVKSFIDTTSTSDFSILDGGPNAAGSSGL